MLFGFLTITSSAAGETSVLLMAYALLWAKLVCGKLEADGMSESPGLLRWGNQEAGGSYSS